MEETRKPQPPDPYDYAHPHPPNGTHLWDIDGVVKILDSSLGFVKKHVAPQLDRIQKHDGGAYYYTLASIIEWDQQQTNRRLNDQGQQRRITDSDGNVWVDGQRVYTSKQVAAALGITTTALTSRIDHARENNPIAYKKRYKQAHKFFRSKTLPRASYWTADQIEEMKNRHGGNHDTHA